jgi:predicted ATPase
MPAPYLRRIWLEPSHIADRAAYPFCLPFLRDEFELSFDRSITIIVGENGTGKSALLEGIAVLAGYDEAGGGNGYMPVDHSKALERMGGQLSKALRAGWLPKITNGWFFRAESFFSVARYQDEVNLEDIPGVPPGTPPDYLSHSHGEGFLRFFEERCQKQGIFIFDEPESALSPARQMEFLKLMTADGAVHNLPGRHGHALADADGLSQRASVTAVEIRPGAGDGRTDRLLQGHARVLQRSGGICGSGGGGMIAPWS